MRLVDLTHRFSIHTPGWVGYPSPKLSYFQRHATNGIVSQWLELPLHSGTHFDSQMHIVSGGADIASLPIDRLCRQGVIVDMGDSVNGLVQDLVHAGPDEEGAIVEAVRLAAERMRA